MTASSGDIESGFGLDEGSSVAAVRELYDRWARLYDWNPVLHLVRPARRRAIERMDLEAGDTVVDMGTGTGANLAPLRDAVGPGGQVLGIDISPGMLDRARTRVEQHGWSNVTLIESDIRDPPLDGPVDGIFSAFVVVMYADPDRLVDGWSTYLESGVLANLYAGPSDRRYAPAANTLLSLYLRAFEEGWETANEGPRPLDVLAARGQRVRKALSKRAVGVEHDDFVFGLAQLDIGRFDG